MRTFFLCVPCFYLFIQSFVWVMHQQEVENVIVQRNINKALLYCIVVLSN